MSHYRLTTALAAALLLVTGCGVAHAPITPQAQLHTSAPCQVPTDRIGDYSRLGSPPSSCTQPHQCLIVADRVQDWIDLRMGLPRCVRRLQHTVAAAPGPVVGRR